MPEPRRRAPVREQKSQRTRQALQAGAELLAHLDALPAEHLARTEPALALLAAQLREDVDLLVLAPRIRNKAARRLQGAESRRRTATRELYLACAKVREAVKASHRGPRHEPIRKAFGVATHATPKVADRALRLAAAILDGALAHKDVARRAGVRPPTLSRIAELKFTVHEGVPERAAFKKERDLAEAQLLEAAVRIEDAVRRFAAHIGGSDGA